MRQSFGITVEQYDKLVTAQAGVCAICHEECKSGRRLAVDHIHGTNPAVIRGLLCAGCNTAVGSLRESPQNCFRAADYLQGNPTLTREYFGD